MRTQLVNYFYDISAPDQKALYKELCSSMKAQGIKCFESWGGGSHYLTSGSGVVELETKNIFANQWNTSTNSPMYPNHRIFDWAQDYPVGGARKSVKKGHYLIVTDEMRAIRHSTGECGYCGAQGLLSELGQFCNKCLDSEYLTEKNLHLLRINPVSDDSGRKPLTADESAILVPAWRTAQIHGTTARGRKRIEAVRAGIEKARVDAIHHAESEYKAKKWLIENAPGLLSNYIYYNHTGVHCFGWRAGNFDETLIPENCPFEYEVKK